VNDLERVLGPRLHDLADEMVGPHPAVPAADAIARHRRQRRTRAGTAALAVAVALVAVGVPTGMSVLGAGHGATAGGETAGGDTAGGETAGTTEPSPTGASTAPSDTAAEASAGEASAAESLAKERLGKLSLQALIAQRVAQPLRLTAPAAWGNCPPASVLSTVAGTPWAYWQGHLPGGPDGCQYVAADGAVSTSTPETRESVGIGFLTGTTVEQMKAGVAGSDSSSGGNCVSTSVSQDGLLQRCLSTGQLRYSLTLPDTGGRGIWVLSVITGDRYSGDPGMALQAVTAAAETAFGR
jgi:hypothetical protein